VASDKVEATREWGATTNSVSLLSLVSCHGLWVAAEHADALDHLAEVRKRALDARLVLVADQVEIK
jgi:hypothetical protein